MKKATSTETADKVRYSTSNKRGCPTCDGIDPQSCSRCQARTRLRDWFNTPNGWHFEKDARGR